MRNNVHILASSGSSASPAVGSVRPGAVLTARERQEKRRAEYLAETGRSEHSIVTWEEIQARRARA